MSEKRVVSVPKPQYTDTTQFVADLSMTRQTILTSQGGQLPRGKMKSANKSVTSPFHVPTGNLRGSWCNVIWALRVKLLYLSKAKYGSQKSVNIPKKFIL